MTVSELAVNILQDTVPRKRAVANREGDRGDVSVTAGEGANTGSTQMDPGPLLNWTLDEYCRERTGLMNVLHFDAMAVDGRNVVVYDRNRFKRDPALSAWKQK